MCGILGSFPVFNDADQFHRSLQRLHHRGPDGEGILHSERGDFSFGHKRLKIIDLDDRSNQPFRFHHLTMVFNGEVYNYLELRAELETLGHSFTTESDTEVICAAFMEWREGCLSRFTGMWALVLWDEKEQVAFMARDRFGQKPLYYSTEGKHLFFGSEMKAVMGLRSSNRVADHFTQSIARPLRYEAMDESLVHAIHRFPAGHFAWLKKGAQSMRPQRYWDTREHLEQMPEAFEDQVAGLRARFEDACRLRLRSDVPIATALSGGVDSSVIYASVQNHLGEKRSHHTAISADFGSSSIDEVPYARKVAAHFGNPLDPVKIDATASLHRLQHDLNVFEEVYLSAPSPMIALYRQMKDQGITVSLDGHGADELMGGYKGTAPAGLFAAFPNVARMRDLLLADDRANDLTDAWLERSDLRVLQAVFTQGTKLGMNAYGTIRTILHDRSLVGLREPLKKALYEAFHNYTLPTLLRNYDHYSMAASVESRMPFLDHRVVAYAFSLPTSAYFHSGWSKAPIRAMYKDQLPAEIAYRRRKIGFNTPFHEWLKNDDWKAFIRDTIHSKSFQTCPVHDGPAQQASLANDLRSLELNTPDFLSGVDVWNKLAPYFWYEYFYKQNA
ncbi:MAG: asparagine synthase (glutamine-hydrolyzing) [Cryomorphaceae bacterium]